MWTNISYGNRSVCLLPKDFIRGLFSLPAFLLRFIGAERLWVEQFSLWSIKSILYIRCLVRYSCRTARNTYWFWHKQWVFSSNHRCIHWCLFYKSKSLLEIFIFLKNKLNPSAGRGKNVNISSSGYIWVIRFITVPRVLGAKLTWRRRNIVMTFVGTSWRISLTPLI